ncbi:MAG: translation initiation factor IF-2 subunit gamma [Candidatus Micrarchaeaceae archaeon]
MNKQSELNIGTLGHVDHGKTTLVSALTHTWTDVHSESLKRSMTIKLGYADMLIRKCESDGKFTVEEKCIDGNVASPFRKISLLDAPGHETLMATAIASSSIIDGALFVISAAEPCPMPQTKEHLMIINALGIKNVIVVQTKIDVVGREKTQKSYEQIKAFLKGSTAENAPIIPIMANKGINVDSLLEELAKIKIPERDTKSNPIMNVARSFDINKPGTKINELVGGVVGGSIIKGTFKEGDEIEIRPGINFNSQKKDNYTPIITKIDSLSAGNERLDSAIAGGLIAVGTECDPSMTKADGFVGQIIGKIGTLPDVVNQITINYTSLNRSDIPKQAFKDGEQLLLGIGTGTFIGYITHLKRNTIEIKLNRVACIDDSAKISVLRNFNQRWKLSGFGVLI